MRAEPEHAASATAARTKTPPWTVREAEILATTLRLLQEHGYDGLTVEAVATEAKAGKGTVYRRWPSKSELVIAAFIEGTRIDPLPPRTGSLRGDLLEHGAAVCQQAREHASTMRAVLPEMARSPALSAAIRYQFVDQRRMALRKILTAAMNRGEIAPALIHDELSDILPASLIFRSLLTGRPPTARTVRALVDDVLLPCLTYGARGRTEV